MTLQHSGDPEEAARIARSALAEAAGPVLAHQGSFTPHTREAVASVLLGDTARALEALKQAVAHGYRDARRLRSTPALDPLRAHPAFQALSAELEQRVVEELRDTAPSPDRRIAGHR